MWKFIKKEDRTLIEKLPTPAFYCIKCCKQFINNAEYVVYMKPLYTQICFI